MSFIFLLFLPIKQVSDLESLLQGPDKKDMQRFHAAAGVVLQGEKMKVGDGAPVASPSGGKGKVQSSTACNIQWLLQGVDPWLRTFIRHSLA